MNKAVQDRLGHVLCHDRRVDDKGREMHTERMTLSVEEAAGVLGISRALAYELVARGELPSLRLGRRIVVPHRALERFVDGIEDTSA